MDGPCLNVEFRSTKRLQLQLYRAAHANGLTLALAAQRQDEMELAAREFFLVETGTLDPNPATVRLNDTARKRQPQPGSRTFKLGFTGRMTVEQVSRLIEFGKDDL
jgi:hypothetical protein